MAGDLDYSTNVDEGYNAFWFGGDGFRLHIYQMGFASF